MKALCVAIGHCNRRGIGRAGAGGLRPPPGAASCSGCHAAGATSRPAPVSRLYGRDAGDITTAMTGFRDGSLPATVMNRIAKGFSDDELRAIAAWLAAQK